MSLKLEARKLTKLAWPILIAQLTQTMMGFVDTVMAGRVSADDLAAVAIAGSIWLPMVLMLQGLIMALPPLVSAFHGSKEYEKIPFVTQQTLWLALALSLLITLLGLAAPQLLAWANDPGPDGFMSLKLQQITGDYLLFLALGVPAFGAYLVLRNYCEGVSITKPTMVIAFIGLIVNVPANYIFVYGKLGMPALGGAGCGLATAIVFWAMFIAVFCYCRMAPKLKEISLFQRLHPIDGAEIWKLIKMGTPIAFSMLFEVTLFAVVAILLAPFGATVVASHQVAINFSSMMFMLPLSLGMAATIRIGYMLGEKDPQGAKTVCSTTFLIGLLTASFTASLSFLLRGPIASIYTQDEVVIQMAADLMLLAAMFQFSDAVQVIAAAALRGYRDMSALFWITFVAYWLVGLPVGCVLGLTDWLGQQYYAAGFWMGFIAALTSAAIMLGLRLRHVQHKSISAVSAN